MNHKPDKHPSVVYFDKIVDVEAAQASCETDPILDREWFLQNPGVALRTRPASLMEKRSVGIGTSKTAFTVVKGTSVAVRLAKYATTKNRRNNP